MKSILTVKVKSNYGVNTLYPICKLSKQFSIIANTKTLTSHTVRCLMKIGYKFARTAESASLSSLSADYGFGGHDNVETQETATEYTGENCPACGSGAIVGEAIEPNDATSAFRQVNCNQCKAVWDEEYKVVGFDGLRRNDKDISLNAEKLLGDRSNEFLCISRNYYGYGSTIEGSVRNMKEAGGPNIGDGYLVFKLDPVPDKITCGCQGPELPTGTEKTIVKDLRSKTIECPEFHNTKEAHDTAKNLATEYGHPVAVIQSNVVGRLFKVQYEYNDTLKNYTTVCVYDPDGKEWPC